MTDLRYPTSRPEMDSNRVVLAEFPRPEAWTEDAACAEYAGDAWFPADFGSKPRPDGGYRPLIAAALAVCRACPVQTDCLEYAMRTDQTHGIWGGVPERERRAMKRAAS